MFFYLSRFFRYVDLVAYSTVYYGTEDQKYTVQELEDLPLFDELVASSGDKDYEEETTANDKRARIKKYIENNTFLTPKEKNLIFKIYRSGSFMGGALTNKDKTELSLLQEKLQLNPGLLQGLEDICNEER